MAAQLGHPDLERDARARGRLLEDQRHAAARQRLRRLAVGLQLGRTVQQGGQLLGRKLLPGQEMASHPGIVRTVTWNLFHGRDHPPDRALFTWRSRLLRRTERNATHVQVNRPLRRGVRLGAGRRGLGRRAAAGGAAALAAGAARGLPRGRRAGPDLAQLAGLACAALAADLNPDLIASGEGGSNMMLVRSPGAIAGHRDGGAGAPARAAHDAAGAPAACPRASGCAWPACTCRWTPPGRGPARSLRAADARSRSRAGEPLLFGGDLNLRPSRQPEAFAELERRHGLAPPTGRRRHRPPAGARDWPWPRRRTPSRRPRASSPRSAGRVLRLSDHDLVAAGFEMR